MQTMTISCFILYFLLSLPLQANSESADAFILYNYSDHVKVLSPKVIKKDISIIIQNKTLVKMMGKIQDQSGRNHTYLTILPSSAKSYLFKNFAKYKTISFVPLSPPAGKIDLILGKGAYEIPPKK